MMKFIRLNAINGMGETKVDTGAEHLLSTRNNKDKK